MNTDKKTIIVQVNGDLKTKFQKRCNQEDLTMAAAIIRLIKKWTTGEVRL